MTERQYQKVCALFYVDGASSLSVSLDDDGSFYAHVQVPKQQHQKIAALVQKVVPQILKIDEMTVDLRNLCVTGQLQARAYALRGKKA